jgi:membrane protease YdiL (CAAX protease family)
MTDVTASYPAATFPAAPARTAVAAPTHPRGIGAILGWFALSLLAFLLAMVLGYALFERTLFREAIPQFIAYAAGALVVVFAAARTGSSAADYLGLRLPPARWFLIGLGLVALELAFNVGLNYVLPTTDDASLLADYRAAAAAPATLVLWWLGPAVFPAVAEEILFRGSGFGNLCETIILLLPWFHDLRKTAWGQ